MRLDGVRRRAEHAIVHLRATGDGRGQHTAFRLPAADAARTGTGSPSGARMKPRGRAPSPYTA